MNNKTLYSSEKNSEEYITVNSCGEQNLGDRDYNTLRENGRIDLGYSLLPKENVILKMKEKLKLPKAAALYYIFRV